MLEGITVTLYVKEKTGVDGFNNPVYSYTTVQVPNVLVSPSTSEDITSSTNLYGKKSIYTLAIPKNDEHVWEDTIVEFFGKKWRTFGFPIKGIDNLIPLDWNTKVMVERYE